MDGFDAGRKIFEYQKLAGIDFVPVVAVTAYDDTATVQTCIEIGMSEVLNKPVNMFKLDKTIQRLYYHNK